MKEVSIIEERNCFQYETLFRETKEIRNKMKKAHTKYLEDLLKDGTV